MAHRKTYEGMKVLVATDGSRGGTAALRFAARLASCDPSVDLTVITIETDGAPALPGAPFAPENVEPLRARHALDSAARALRRLGVRGETKLVRARPRQQIPEAIAREADRRKVDLVVVGSEGRDTLREWVVGGVALRLIYLARRPVTVVRPARRRRTA